MKIVVHQSREEKKIRLLFPSFLLVNHVTAPLGALVFSRKLKKHGIKIPIRIALRAVNEYYGAKKMLQRKGLSFLDIQSSNGEQVQIDL